MNADTTMTPGPPTSSVECGFGRVRRRGFPMLMISCSFRCVARRGGVGLGNHLNLMGGAPCGTPFPVRRSAVAVCCLTTHRFVVRSRRSQLSLCPDR